MSISNSLRVPEVAPRGSAELELYVVVSSPLQIHLSWQQIHQLWVFQQLQQMPTITLTIFSLVPHYFGQSFQKLSVWIFTSAKQCHQMNLGTSESHIIIIKVNHAERRKRYLGSVRLHNRQMYSPPDIDALQQSHRAGWLLVQQLSAAPWAWSFLCWLKSAG